MFLNTCYCNEKLQCNLLSANKKDLNGHTKRRWTKSKLLLTSNISAKLRESRFQTKTKSNAKISLTIIKDGVINLAGKELDKNKIRFLNLGTKFIQTYNRQPPYLGIIQTTEIYMIEQASAYEKQGRTTIACLVTKFRGYRRVKSRTPLTK